MRLPRLALDSHSWQSATLVLLKPNHATRLGLPDVVRHHYRLLILDLERA